MKFLLMKTTTAAAALFALSATALAECKIISPELDTTLRTSAQQRQTFDVNTTRDLRKLRNAAHILQSYGLMEACQNVAAAIQEITKDPVKNAEVRDTYYSTQGRMIITDDRPYDEKLKSRQASAVLLSESAGSINANEMIGADVHNHLNEDVGEIQNLILSDKGQPAYVVVASGGFLGLGEKWIAVPFSKVKVSADGGTYYVNMTEEQIDAAPDFDIWNFNWEKSADWRAENEKYFDANVKIDG